MEEKSISSDLIRGHIDTIILYSLKDNDKYAQQISDDIESKSNNEYKINQATLYSSLKRLEGLKHISSYWQDADASGRRKFFHLTEQGLGIVNKNLENWSYSKTIIDKLMDCKSPEPSTIVYVTKTTQEPIIEEKPAVLPSNEVISTQLSQEKQQVIQEKPLETPINTQKEIAEENFRFILNDLIKQQPTKKVVEEKEKVSVNLEPQQPVLQSDNSKISLNETISTVDYSKKAYLNNGKIDFSDLQIKVAQQGYKLRVSSKDSAASEGTLLINKLNVFSALVLFLLVLVEFVPSCIYCFPKLNVGILEVIVFFALITIPFMFFVYKYFTNPKKISNKPIYKDSILTVGIVVFNLLLITFAIALVGELDFGSKAELVRYLYSPVVLMLDAVIFMIIRTVLAKSKIFYKKKEK